MNPVLALRRSADLTQSQLAERAGIAQPNVSAYESGRRKPSAATMQRLRAAASGYPHDAVAARRTELIVLAQRHGFDDLRLFGSVARRTDRPGSDVDLLVRVPPGTGLMALSAFALEAEALLGVHVDLVTDGGLRKDHPIRAEAVSL